MGTLLISKIREEYPECGLFDGSDDVDVRRDLAKTTAQTNITISLHERVTKVMKIKLCSIRGDWKLINGIHWDFIVDDERGSCLSMILEDISYNDLIEVVLENFGIDVSPSKLNSINLSYVSPSKLNFSSKELPPVFIRNDRQVASYMNKLQENGCLHLCITIKKNSFIIKDFVKYDSDTG
ncbi:hypothetical protein YC2023_105121 [Brassica napus]